jgi:hypothetical protein
MYLLLILRIHTTVLRNCVNRTHHMTITMQLYITLSNEECGIQSVNGLVFNPLTPNDLQRRRAVSSLKIKIPTKHMREKPTNSPIIHSVY